MQKHRAPPSGRWRRDRQDRPRPDLDRAGAGEWPAFPGGVWTRADWPILDEPEDDAGRSTRCESAMVALPLPSPPVYAPPMGSRRSSEKAAPPAATFTTSEAPLHRPGTEPVPHVRWVPSSSSEPVLIEIVQLDKSLAVRWQSSIQPAIDEDPTRTDQGWRWPRIMATTSLVGALQRPTGLAACVQAQNGDYIPCAMVQVVARYPAFDDRNENCVFLWYLADAPIKALEQLLPKSCVPKMLGTVALDMAVTLSLNQGLHGRTGLHADPKGKEKLTAWYASKGMANLPSHAPRPSIFRANDGRFFYYTPAMALTASQKLDKFRAIGVK